MTQPNLKKRTLRIAISVIAVLFICWLIGTYTDSHKAKDDRSGTQSRETSTQSTSSSDISSSDIVVNSPQNGADTTASSEGGLGVTLTGDKWSIMPGDYRIVDYLEAQDGSSYRPTRADEKFLMIDVQITNISGSALDPADSIDFAVNGEDQPGLLFMDGNTLENPCPPSVTSGGALAPGASRAGTEVFPVVPDGSGYRLEAKEYFIVSRSPVNSMLVEKQYGKTMTWKLTK